MPELNNDGLMTDAEVSEMIGLDRVTLYRLRQAGKLGFYKFGKVIRYSQEHVQAFLRSHEQLAKKQRSNTAGGKEN